MHVNIEKVIKALREIGAEDVVYREGKHYQLLFSFSGTKATPIVISKTPSDRNVMARVAADVIRELKRLGATPEQFAGLRPTLRGVLHLYSPVLMGRADTSVKQRIAWQQLQAIAAGDNADQPREDYEMK